MWNKREEEPIRPALAPQTASPPSGAAGRREPAAIGPSISIVGDISGDEDLSILGKVQGKIELPQHTVSVGEPGHVDADIRAKIVSVAGEVHGNLVASEQILIRKTATMLGNLTAPRVGLEDGCRFRGSVEMEARPEKGRLASVPAPRPQSAVAPVKPAELTSPAAGGPGVPAKPESPPGHP
jgi:cytoskeletal protein CcmA (bactofilin family)